MKKLMTILGMSSIFLIASCSYFDGVKKPDKGSAVDNISIQYRTSSNALEDLEISNNDSFDDVYKSLKNTYFEMAQEESSFGYRSKNNMSYSQEITNYISNDNFLAESYKDSYASSTTIDAGVKRYNNDNNIGSNIDFYYKRTSTAAGALKIDSYKKAMATYYEKGFAGTEYESNTTYSTNSGNYYIEKIEESEKIDDSNTKSSTKSSVYKHIDQKCDREDQDIEYYGYSEDGTKYTYSLINFVNTAAIYDYNVANNFYKESFSELYENSYELTDKYIILNIKANYTDYIYDLAIQELELETKQTLFDDATVINKIKEINKDNKSYRETTIWIDYTKPYDYSDTSIKKLSYGYYKNYVKNNVNIEGTYDVDYLDYHYSYIDDSFAKTLIGTEFKKKYSSEEEYEIAINNDSYDNKINSMNKKCEKKNVFKDIVFNKVN